MSEIRMQSIQAIKNTDQVKYDTKSGCHLSVVLRTKTIASVEKPDLYLMPGKVNQDGGALWGKRGTVRITIHHLTPSGNSMSHIMPDKSCRFFTGEPIRPLYHPTYTYCGYRLVSEADNCDPIDVNLEEIPLCKASDPIISGASSGASYTLYFYYTPNLVIKHITTDGRSLDGIFSDRVDAMELGEKYVCLPPTHAEYVYAGYYTTENGDILAAESYYGQPDPYTYEGAVHPMILTFYYRRQVNGVNCARLLPQGIEDEAEVVATKIVAVLRHMKSKIEIASTKPNRLSSQAVDQVQDQMVAYACRVRSVA